MFIHSALFWLRPDLTAADRASFEHELRLLAQAPYLLQAHVGRAAATEHRGVTDNGFDYATSFHFKSYEDHAHYQTACPLHAAFVARCKGFWDRVVVHDIEPFIEPLAPPVQGD